MFNWIKNLFGSKELTINVNVSGKVEVEHRSKESASLTASERVVNTKKMPETTEREIMPSIGKIKKPAVGFGKETEV